MASFRSELIHAQRRMEEAGYGEQAAQLYLLELSNEHHHDLYMEMDQEMSAELCGQYRSGIERMIGGEPLGYVLGYEWFYGYRIQVNESVLIPRPETEELLANILAEYDEYFSDQYDVTAVDIGTGSGAIAVALKKEAPGINMIATDISAEAVAVARQNALANEAAVSMLIGDMLEPLYERNLKVDMLISNPPYIPQNEVMEKSVVDFEPHLALFGGDNGLKFYRQIFSQCRRVLKERALLAFEMGWNQKAAMEELVKEFFPHDRYEIRKDMSGKDRMLFIFVNL